MTGQCNEVGLTSQEALSTRTWILTIALWAQTFSLEDNMGVFPDRSSYVQSRGPQSPEHRSQQGVYLPWYVQTP